MKYLFILFFFMFILKVEAQNEISANYIGFYQEKLENKKVRLEFEIRNLTKDTVYIYNDNFKIEVYKNRKKLVEQKPNYGIGTPFVRPRINPCPEITNIKNQLAKNYIKKLLLHNEIDKIEFESVIDNTYFNCLVLLPKEIIYYTEYFRQDNFDKNCEVEINYNPKNTFLKFITEKSKVIELKK